MTLSDCKTAKFDTLDDQNKDSYCVAATCTSSDASKCCKTLTLKQCGSPPTGGYFKDKVNSDTPYTTDKNKECFHKCSITDHASAIATFKTYGLDVTIGPKSDDITNVAWVTSPKYTPVFPFKIPAGGTGSTVDTKKWVDIQKQVPVLGTTLTCKEVTGKTLAYYIDYGKDSGSTPIQVLGLTVTEGFENYVPQPIKEILDWIAGRPDMNEKSNLSLLPGYLN